MGNLLSFFSQTLEGFHCHPFQNIVPRQSVSLEVGVKKRFLHICTR